MSALMLASLCAVLLGACADTVQQKPIPHNILEALIAAPQPVYWLGASFHGFAIIEATHDVGGAYSVQYGNCIQGGQGTCVSPVRIITSPDNSFVPGSATASLHAPIRGAGALVAQAGATIVIPTGVVVVSIYARTAALARSAAETMVPINEPGAPGAPLPLALPDSGFGEKPLPAQVPPPLQALKLAAPARAG